MPAFFLRILSWTEVLKGIFIYIFVGRAAARPPMFIFGCADINQYNYIVIDNYILIVIVYCYC